MKTLIWRFAAIISLVAIMQTAGRELVPDSNAAVLQATGLQPAGGMNPWDLLRGLVTDAQAGFTTWESACSVYEEQGQACSEDVQEFHVFNFDSISALTSSHVAGKAHPSAAEPSAGCAAELPQNEDSIWFNDTAAPVAARAVKASLTSGTSPSSAIPAITFPPGSEIIRAEFEAIHRNSGTVCLHLYDTNVASNWSNADFPLRSIDLGSANCSTWDGQDPIPVGCFYSPKLTPANLKFFQGASQTPITVNDTIVLLGFHVIKKGDDSNWLWSTFWWQAEENQPAQSHSIGAHFCGSDCNDLDPAWQHYVMNFMGAPPTSGPIPAVFNPYLDGILTNPSETNCLVCHSFAAANGKPTANVADTLGAKGNITNAQLNDLVIGYFTSKMLQTNNVWSLALRLTKAPSTSAVIPNAR
jgi:hypothetical protein